MPINLKTNSLLLFFSVLLLSSSLKAQDKLDIKFGRVSPQDFNIDLSKVDTSYGAVIIADLGSSSFQGNQKGWFSLVFNHQIRIKILNKKGFDLGNFTIPIYVGDHGDEEKITSFRASTYNLEDGKVVETKLGKDAKFSDREDKNHILKKFSFSNVKNGSILEYNYTITSDFIANLQPWEFQGMYPVLWSEYEADIPEFFIYNTQAQGYIPFDISKTSNSNTDYKVTFNGNDNFSHPETYSLTSNNTDRRWVIKNVPAFREEKFTSSAQNYISKIDFQLSGQQFPQSAYHDYLGTWNSLSEKLMQADYFGADLKRNAWLNEDLNTIKSSGKNSPIELAQKIYAFVQANYKWKGSNQVLLSQSLRETGKNKSGNTADLNLLLTSMLLHENFQADPVILSTRSHGFVSDVYPLLDRFNYVICRLTIDSNTYLLDASKPYLSFGRIPYFCYNGNAKVLTQNPSTLVLLADNIKETEVTNVQLLNSGPLGGNWSGKFNQGKGQFESDEMRSEIQSKGYDAVKKDIKDRSRTDLSLDSIRI